MESAVFGTLWVNTVRPVPSLICGTIQFFMSDLRRKSFIEQSIPLKDFWNVHIWIRALSTSNKCTKFFEITATQQRGSDKMYTILYSGIFAGIVKPCFSKHLSLKSLTKVFFSNWLVPLPFYFACGTLPFTEHLGDIMVRICFTVILKVYIFVTCSTGMFNTIIYCFRTVPFLSLPLAFLYFKFLFRDSDVYTFSTWP